ncbi:hypothetical protein DFJ73DRAFT_829029 [Zopfochytrium polystomum]|nr:hypothetical protein DFJ73DRAFT_829029 [Zopfochytrium polystomum]
MKWAELSPHPTNARNPTPPNTAEQESLPYVEPNGTTFRRAQKPPASAGSIGSRRLIDDVSVRSALRCLPLAPAFKPTLCNRMAKRFAGSGSPPMATSATAATAVAALTAPAALDAESKHTRGSGATRGLSRLARERVVLDSVLSAWLVTSDGGCDSACRCDVGAASNDGDHETEEGREQSKHGHRADECRAEPVDLLYPSSRFLRASGMGTIVQRYAAECFGFAVGRDSVPWGARPPKPLMVRVVGRPKPAVLVKTERKRVASPVEPEGARPERSAPLEDSTAVDPQASAAPIPETELPITEAKNVIAMDTTRWDEGEALRVVFTPYAGDKPVDWELGDASVVSSWDNEGSDRLAHVKTPFEVRTVAEGLPEDEALVVQSDATA